MGPPRPFFHIYVILHLLEWAVKQKKKLCLSVHGKALMRLAVYFCDPVRFIQFG
jgi:hypothetical protein